MLLVLLIMMHIQGLIHLVAYHYWFIIMKNAVMDCFTLLYLHSFLSCLSVLIHYHEMLHLVTLEFTKVVNNILRSDGYPLPAYADREFSLLIVLTVHVCITLKLLYSATHLTGLPYLFNQEACIWKVILKRNLA